MEFLAYYFGFLNRHRAATPVLIGSPRATSVGRRFMRIAGRFSRATGVHSLPRTQRSAVASRLLAWAVAQCCHVAALAQRLSSPSLALRGLAASRGLRLASFPVSARVKLVVASFMRPIDLSNDWLVRLQRLNRAPDLR